MKAAVHQKLMSRPSDGAESIKLKVIGFATHFSNDYIHLGRHLRELFHSFQRR